MFSKKADDFKSLKSFEPLLTKNYKEWIIENFWLIILIAGVVVVLAVCAKKLKTSENTEARKDSP